MSPSQWSTHFLVSLGLLHPVGCATTMSSGEEKKSGSRSGMVERYLFVCGAYWLHSFSSGIQSGVNCIT